MEPDTDNFSRLPQFGSTGAAGKPYACSSQDESTGDSDDCLILDPLDVTPLSYAFPLQSPSASSAAPNPSSAPGQAADSAVVVSGKEAQTRKRAGSASSPKMTSNPWNPRTNKSTTNFLPMNLTSYLRTISGKSTCFRV